MSLHIATARVPVRRALDHAMAGNDGLLSRKEALALGATIPMIKGLVRRGAWLVAYDGVYRSASAPRTPVQHVKAALLAAGDGAMVSHLSATWIWALLASPPAQPHVSVPQPRRVRLPGVAIHRPRDMIGRRPVLRNGLWVTDPMRTILDSAGVLPDHLVDLIVDRAIAKKLVTANGLAQVLERSGKRGRPGTAALRSSMAKRGVVCSTRVPSVLEATMARLLARFGLADAVPEYVPFVGAPYRFDFAWPEVKVAVEVDGYEKHSSYESFRYGIARDRWILKNGWVVAHFSWDEVQYQPEMVAAEIRAVLQSRTLVID